MLYLTEWPQLTFATFDPAFLKAPKEVLISEMVEHQKYFPTADHKGSLDNTFIITADNTPNPLIRKGNQKVLSARLADGIFLYEQDLKTPLQDFNRQLSLMTQQKELGSMLDKVKRLIQIAHIVNEHLHIADPKKLEKAALLCKSDLASALVKEFPALQGTIGKYYAAAQGEDPEVAEAIGEHWMPRFEGASLPKTKTGIALSLADKIDNLIGCYCAGLKPSSSSDPYALRRQTIGLLKILIENKESIRIDALLEKACAVYPCLKGSTALVPEILAFITARVKSVFEDYGFQKVEIEASIKGICTDPYDQFCKTQALHVFRNLGAGFAQLLEVYKRAKGQLSERTERLFNPSLAKEPAEIQLIAALEAIYKPWQEAIGKRKYLDAFQLMASLQPPLAKLFDEVKILTEDLALRDNRIALLQNIFDHFAQLVDFKGF